MAATTAAEALTGARRLVLKVGSALLVDWETGSIDRRRLDGLAADIAGLRQGGGVKGDVQVLVVSSGAVALGRRRLNLPARALGLEHKQAAAAAGQSLLMRAWEQALEPHGLTTAQILLTRDDTETRRRWLNARATVNALLALGAVPVVNENDTVVTEEIRYGDNDRLAARVAQMIGADLLVLLSDVDGLYTADPRRVDDARHLAHVQALTPEIEAMAGGANGSDGVGTGGMATKLMAARLAGDGGCATVVADGRAGPSPLTALRDGARATLFSPRVGVHAAYKQWIGGTLSPRGVLLVDEGCARALMQGRSLLAVGLTGLEGRFGKGDAVLIRDSRGRELGRGLARLDSADVSRILGLRSDAVARELGRADDGVVIHADDLALK